MDGFKRSFYQVCINIGFCDHKSQTRTHTHKHTLSFSSFSGPNRLASCIAVINGAGAICCENDILGACQGGLFHLGSGDELQTSVCCSGRNSCQNAEFTGSGLRVLSCEGGSACIQVVALLAGDLSCNGNGACSGSSVDFQGSNAYPGFAFLVSFHF